MFRKLMTFLRKFEKVVNVLVNVTRGLVVCRTCLESIRSVASPDSVMYKKISNVLKYVNTASDSLQTVLTWFGYGDDVCMAQPRGLADEELEEIGTTLRREITNGQELG